MDEQMMQEQQQQPPEGGPAPVGDTGQGPQGAVPEGMTEAEPGAVDPMIAEEVSKGVQAVSRVLYEEEGVSDQILKMVNDKEKVGSAAKATVMLVTQVDKQIDLMEEAIAAVTAFAVDRLLELVDADARSKIEYSDDEAKQVMMTTMELILTSYGVTPEESQATHGDVPQEEIDQYGNLYQETLNA
tara:strand:- start:120 stop:677 length:558 start_codon:yes stop_codon:yes gene_type:complete